VAGGTLASLRRSPGMTERRRVIYRSANGDAWFLCRDGVGWVYVEHEPNLPSGGKASRIDVGTFLARGAAGPEHQALLSLIDTLAEQGPADKESVRTA
jgi:hypothetical protein